MSNCLIGGLNWIYEGLPTFTGGAWQLPLTSLENWDTKDYTRSSTAALADTQFNVAFDAERPVDTIFLGYHNGTNAARFRVREGGAPLELDLTTYTSGQVPTDFNFSCPSTRSYWDATGVLRYAGANAPRYDHHPFTGEALGFFTEVSSEYLGVNSEDFSTWVSDGASVQSDFHTAPDGTTTMDRIVDTTASTVHGRTQAVTFSPLNFYRAAWFAQNASRSWQVLRIFDGSASKWVFFNASTGVVGHKSSGVTTTVQQLANSFWRVCAEFQVSAGAGAGLIGLYAATADGGDATPSYVGNGSHIRAWGVTLEVGAASGYPGSYVPTSASSVVRHADGAMVLASTAFTDVIPAGSKQGTLSVEFSFPFIAGTFGSFVLAQIDDTTNNYVALYGTNTSTVNGVVFRTPTTEYLEALGAIQPNVESIAAIAFSDTRIQGALDGTGAAIDTSATISEYTRMYFGGGAVPMHIRKIGLSGGVFSQAGLVAASADFADFDENVPAIVPWTDLIPTTHTPTDGRIFFGRNSDGKKPSDERDPRGECCLVILDEAVDILGCVVEIDDTANPDGYFQFSILWMGKSEYPDPGVVPGFAIQNVEDSRKKRSLGGSFFGRTLWKRKRVVGALQEQQESFALPFYHELTGKVGTTQPILFSLYPGAAGINQDRLTILGVLEEPSPVENTQYIYWGFPFAIVQL
jgi:hypothetical protein